MKLWVRRGAGPGRIGGQADRRIGGRTVQRAVRRYGGTAVGVRSALHRRYDLVAVRWIESVDRPLLRNHAFGKVEPLSEIHHLLCVVAKVL